MSIEERLADQAFRASLVRVWPARFERLESRKIKPMTRKAFAEAEEINYFSLSRYLNGRTLPDWEIIKKINTGLKKRKV